MADDSVGEFPRTRKEAQDTRAKRYFTGEACGNGHISPRLASNGGCIGCTQAWYAANAQRSRIAARAWQIANPERNEETRLAYRVANPEKVRKASLAWKAVNQQKNRDTERAYRAAHRDKYREHDRRWRRANPDKVRDSVRSYRAANLEKYQKEKSAYRAAHPEMMRKCRKAWKEANPDKVRAINKATCHRRRARQVKADGNHTAKDVSRIRKSQKDRCGYCREKLKGKGHVDHILALSRGGRNSPDNLQLLCEPCNLSKSARDPIEFAQSRGFLI